MHARASTTVSALTDSGDDDLNFFSGLLSDKFDCRLSDYHESDFRSSSLTTRSGCSVYAGKSLAGCRISMNIIIQYSSFIVHQNSNEHTSIQLDAQ